MYEKSFQRRIVNKNSTGPVQRKNISKNNRRMAVTPPSFTKSKAVCGEVVPKENHINLELGDTENPDLSIFWGHTSYQLIARDSPMVLFTSPGTMFPVGFLLFL